MTQIDKVIEKMEENATVYKNCSSCTFNGASVAFTLEQYIKELKKASHEKKN